MSGGWIHDDNLRRRIRLHAILGAALACVLVAPPAVMAAEKVKVRREARAVDTSRPDRWVGNGTPRSCTSRAVVRAVARGGIIGAVRALSQHDDRPVTVVRSRVLPAGTRMTGNHAREGGGAVFFVSNDRTGVLEIRSSTLRDNPSDGFETDPGISSSAASRSSSIQSCDEPPRRRARIG